MKKLLQMLVVPAFCLVAMQIGSANVSAVQPNCDDASISNTGASSTNEIICENDETIVIKCSNDTIVRIDVDQDAESGNATSSQNTSGGGASTGNAENESTTDIDVDSACAEAAAAPINPTSTTPTTVVKPKAVAAAEPAKTAQQNKVVAALPVTSGFTPLMTTAVIATAVASFAAIAQGSVALYRKFSA